jgi:hypothetical protein
MLYFLLQEACLVYPLDSSLTIPVMLYCLNDPIFIVVMSKSSVTPVY